MTLLIIQVMASITVLFISWEMYCDKPLRWFVTVYIVRLVLTAPIVIYTHLIPPRRRSTVMISPRTSARSDLAEAYAMSERNRPLSVPPPALPTPTNHRHYQQQQQQQQQYPALMTPVQQPPIPALHDDPFDENVLRQWIDRFSEIWLGFICCIMVYHWKLHALFFFYLFGYGSPALLSLTGFVMLEDDCHITMDHVKGEGRPRRSGMLDKLWLYLGLMEPPCESEPVYEMMEILDVQDQVCVICLSTYENGDMLSRLWCKHHFHRACIKEWLILNRRCPLCKQDFGGKDVLFDI
ncbi:uncharacterized protein EV154DRAFT_468952 [Mucor mucedo]|uniref:uncharacterized protein n=1 Tax=Mucor mucedo TaxID=29922 RepID=UPI00221F98EB|nr:uncharacterized protein EV154DRAFT_468952 [Mucor mucedo]KAI7888387.1 hypothetical protein EV154DRAFT_468952 [Mucor mucedo]